MSPVLLITGLGDEVTRREVAGSVPLALERLPRLSLVRIGRLALIAAALAGTPGCLVVSLHPAYEERTVGFDERLLGRWVNEEEGLDLQIERGEWKSYRLTMRTGRETIAATAHLTHVGRRAFIDVMPSSGADRDPLLLPMHAVYQIELENGQLSVAAIDYDALRNRVGRGSAGVRAALDERQNIVLTATTATLREWLGRGSRGAPFATPLVFRRSQDG